MIEPVLDKPKAPPGLYVHVPFCASRCRYCAFVTGTKLELMERYLTAIEAEVALRALTWDGFDTVYLGGGTPSLLGPERLVRLVRALEPLGIAEGASRTLEVNPDDCSKELLWAARVMGFERVSMGVQSTDDRALRFLRRRHDAAAVELAVSRARSAGFEDISLDLIYALPGQSLGHWRRQLEAALRLEPSHLSCYELTVEEGTPLAMAVADGTLELPDDEQRRELFLAGAELLGSRGWDHYEVSSFARGPQHRARHNLKYWRHTPYLGLGPGAHSYDGFFRWWNERTVPRYAAKLAAGEPPIEAEETLDGEAHRLERLSLGFRQKGGVAIEDLRGDPVIIRAAVEDGLLLREGDRVIPTRLGFLVADGLALRFA
jgi:putative oxygen-independent coproporphyrinogen III oxidase